MCVQNDEFFAVRCHAFFCFVLFKTSLISEVVKSTAAVSVRAVKLYKYYLSAQRSSALLARYHFWKNVTVLSITRNDRRKRYERYEYEKNIKINNLWTSINVGKKNKKRNEKKKTTSVRDDENTPRDRNKKK